MMQKINNSVHTFFCLENILLVHHCFGYYILLFHDIWILRSMKYMIEMIVPYTITLSFSSTKSESRETKTASKWNILPISKFKSSYHFGWRQTNIYWCRHSSYKRSTYASSKRIRSIRVKKCYVDQIFAKGNSKVYITFR